MSGRTNKNILAFEAWQLETGGVLNTARHVPSPNFDDRPDGSCIELLVVHSISLPPGKFGGPGIVQLFTNNLKPHDHPSYASIAELRVSSHFLIRRDGYLIQFVPCLKRAWHAGESVWRDRERCNDFSVGIELEGTDDSAFTDIQYAVLGRLARTLMAAYPVVDCVAHSDIARPIGRKTDPGPHFDWARFWRQLGHS